MTHLRPIRICWLVVLLSACVTTNALPPDRSTSVVLASVSTSPETYGTLIYEGRVFPLVGERSAPTYTYQRRVDGHRFTSFTRQADQPVLIQVAEEDPAGALSSFTEYQFQLGEVGAVVMSGQTAEFHLAHGAEERVARETVELPVVVGPTLYRFVSKSWSRLLGGETVPFRFAVLSRLETVGFELRTMGASPGQVRVEMRASSAVIRLAVDPIVITYTAEGQLVALDGRVPTKLKVADKWTDFDAHVDYVNAATPFQ